MGAEAWSTVDGDIAERLLRSDPVLDPVPAANGAAGPKGWDGAVPALVQ